MPDTVRRRVPAAATALRACRVSGGIPAYSFAATIRAMFSTCAVDPCVRVTSSV